jgi:hypothetical protein
MYGVSKATSNDNSKLLVTLNTTLYNFVNERKHYLRVDQRDKPPRHQLESHPGKRQTMRYTQEIERIACDFGNQHNQQPC